MLLEAVLVVLAVSFVALGLGTRPLRIDVWPGLVVAITIPLVLAITFVAMYYWDVGLHKISLGSLIIALGLLVDDAIIAVEMMVRKLEEGYDKVRAATFTYELVSMPMLTGTLITAAGFLPIGLAQSATGEYTFAIFAVTTDAFIVYSSNVCAILGLRALYFLLAGVIHKFHYLKLGLSIVLVFVGAKMLIAEFYKIPIVVSLLVVAAVLTAAIVLSLMFPKKEPEGTQHLDPTHQGETDVAPIAESDDEESK